MWPLLWRVDAMDMVAALRMELELYVLNKDIAIAAKLATLAANFSVDATPTPYKLMISTSKAIPPMSSDS